MIDYDKQKIKDQIDDNMVFQLLEEWGGEPIWGSSYILSNTICHNPINEGSLKLYYYFNSKLFQCYTNCGSFDIFELYIKIVKIQKGKDINLNDAVRAIAQRLGIISEYIENEDDILIDWQYLSNYDRIKEIELNNNHIILKEYDSTILNKFNYDLKIFPWIEEGISQEVIKKAQIGFYPGGDQITIPHFDYNNRFIGLRGRTLCEEEGERFGKYRPMKVNQQLYNHPLGMNLYGLNWSKNNIKLMKKIIIYESEKSSLKYASYFGWDNNITVACCGSNISAYQIQLLLNLGVEEVIIAFDKQYQEIGDQEFQLWTKKLKAINSKYKNFFIISNIFDTENLLEYKMSPIDAGPEIFLHLFKNRLTGDGKKYQ